MFLHIFRFELLYRARRPVTYVYFLIYLMVGLLYGSVLFGSFGLETAITIAGGGQNLLNSPFNLHILIATVGGAIGVFAIAAFMGVPVYRDFEHQTQMLFFTKPIRKIDYLAGRYLGSLCWAGLALVGVLLGFMLALHLPNVVEERLGPFQLYHYLHPFWMSVLPFAFFTGSIFFATVTLSRNPLFIYLNAIVVLVLLVASGTLTEQLENKFLAALLDPTGSAALANITEFWTVAEKNTQTIPYAPVLMLNHLIWMGLGLAILVGTYFRFSFVADNARRVATRRRRSNEPVFRQIADTVSGHKIALPSVSPSFSQASFWALMRRLAGQEFRGIVRSPVFLAITGVGVLLIIISATLGGQIYETPTLPVTYEVLDLVSGSFAQFLLAIIIFYSGEVVWKERSVRVNLMFDALPVPNWVVFGGKLLALLGVLLLLSGVMMVCGLLIQTFQGYFRYELGLYVQTLFFYDLLPFLTFTALSFFVQVMLNNKFLGFFVVVLFFFFNSLFLNFLGIEDKLLRFNGNSGLVYSDMNGFGHYLPGYLSFFGYWGAFSGILLLISSLYWVRGSDVSRKARSRNARQNFGPIPRLVLVVLLLLFVGLGSFIYYNTHVLNPFYTSKQLQKLQADYEKKYKKYAQIPQPKVTGVKLEVDLFPESRKMQAKGTYTLQNKTKQDIKEIHLILFNRPQKYSFSFSVPTQALKADEKFDYYIYPLKKALKPGQQLRLNFELAYTNEGFRNRGSNTDIVHNGTFFNNFAYFPLIGYQEAAELGLDEIRQKQGLPPRPRTPAIDDPKGQQENFINQHSDFITFEATLSTAPDQIAIAPGYLQKEWQKNGRRYFQYKMDAPILNFYSILSGRFAVKKDIWKGPLGDTVRLEIFHHPVHAYNLDRMMKGMKKALDYYSTHFGPYQHRQARIIEFPRYAGFAQSFPNTIPYSESLGFIANVRKKDDIDYVFYVTAHEIAHQWWGHQIVPANTQGAGTISESMSQYGALMVMEKEYGPDQMKKFLRLELDRYLRGRGSEIKEEKPLLLTENQQYIHYQKGSVVMYALKDLLGEERLNRAIRAYVQDYRFKGPPYTTMKDLLGYLRRETPDSLRYLLRDMIETITLYDLEVKSVTYQPIGKEYEVEITFSAQKLRADGTGKESKIKMQDYVDVGIFGEKKVKGKTETVPIYFKKHRLSSQDQSLRIRVAQKPSRAGLDPYHKLIDRKPDDNLRPALLKETSPKAKSAQTAPPKTAFLAWR